MFHSLVSHLLSDPLSTEDFNQKVNILKTANRYNSFIIYVLIYKYKNKKNNTSFYITQQREGNNMSTEKLTVNKKNVSEKPKARSFIQEDV